MPSMRTASRPATGKFVLPRIYYLLYQRKIHKNQSRLEKAIKEVQSASKNVTDLMRSEENIAQRLESAQEEVSKLERDLTEVDTVISRLKTELLKLGVSQDEISLNSTYQIAELESANSLSAIDLEAQLSKLQTDRIAMIKLYSQITSELSVLNAQYASHKHNLQHLQSSAQSVDLVQQKAHLSSRIKFLQQERDGADAEIATVEQETIQLDESRLQNNQLLQKLHQERDQGAAKIESLISQIALLKSQRGETSAQIVSLGADLCSLKQKVDQQLSEVSDRRKVLSLKNTEVQMPSLLKLKDALATKPIEGVYGLLLDVVKFQPKLQMAYEALLGPKMFSFVVRDQEAANQLVSLNKQIHGGRILVYPLSWMEESLGADDEQDAAKFKSGAIRNVEFAYPADSVAEKCIILESHMEVSHPDLLEDKYLHRLLAFLLKAKLMVPDLEVASKLAKAYECDCVTATGEIVYARGFLNKLGASANRSNTLSEYLKYREAHNIWSSSTENLHRVQARYEDLKTEELRLASDIQQLSLQKDKEASLLSRVWEELSEYQRAVLVSSQAIQELEERKDGLKAFLREALTETKKLSDELAKLDKPGNQTSVLNPKRIAEEIEATLEQLSADKKLILSKTSLQRDLHESISKLDREECGLHEKKVWSEKLTLNRQFRDKESSFVSKNSRRNEELVADLTKRLQLRETSRIQIRKALEAAEDNLLRSESMVNEKRKGLKEARLELQSLNQRRFDLQISTDTFEQKIQNLHIDKSDPEHKRALAVLEHKKDLDLVASLKELMIAKLRYTQKDKANFEQLERFFQTHTDLQGELENLTAGKKVFAEVAGKILVTEVPPTRSQKPRTLRGLASSESDSEPCSRDSTPRADARRSCSWQTRASLRADFYGKPKGPSRSDVPSSLEFKVPTC